MDGGVIDPDYIGPIKVILHNFGYSPFTVNPKDRIVQLIIKKYLSPPIKLTDITPITARDDNGFGSTGKSTPSNTSNENTKTPKIVPYEKDEVAPQQQVAVYRLRTLLHSCQL